MREQCERKEANLMCAVVTSIHRPVPAMRMLVKALKQTESELIVVGDRKSPSDYPLPGASFYSLPAQRRLSWRLPKLLPEDSYARKNVGYLIAIHRGASLIYETDDDTAPLANWRLRSSQLEVQAVQCRGWYNVYQRFSRYPIWPRGFPLEEISRRQGTPRTLEPARRSYPIQQGLVDGSPDVDAIWRLVAQRPIRFARRSSIALRRGTWCPFNSQNTWWYPVAYPLMYLPTHCSIRLTDIWRSFVAQRCLWEIDSAVVFHAADTFQRRNPHDLLSDFNQEISGYLQNGAMCRSLSRLRLQRGRRWIPANLRRCYECWVAEGFFPKAELNLLTAWLADLR